MILYGYKHRNIELASGQFFCENCDTGREYKHISIVRYFTLFFVPLFPLGTVSSYIECQTCMTTYKPEEIAALPDNQQLAADMAARKEAANRKQKATGGRNLAVIGLVMSLISTCMLAILTLFQLTSGSNPLDDLMGTFLLAAVCPLPLLLAGAASLIWGLRIRRSVTEATI